MRYFIVLIAILVVSTEAQADWKVGLPVCLTTGCAVDGDNSVKGVQLAAEDLNSKGGVLGQKVALVVEDTAEGISAAQAVTAYRKLRTDESIRYFIGPTWTPAGLAIAPIAVMEQIVITSPTLGVKEFSATGQNIFNVYGPDESGSRYLAKFAFEQGWKRAAIFSSQQPWDAAQAEFFEDEYKKVGGIITSKQEPLPDRTDLNVEALKIISSKPDVVFFSNVGGQISIAMMKLRQLGYSGHKLAVWLDEKLIRDAKGAAEGTIESCLTEAQPWFVEKFKAKYGTIPERAADTGYDTLMVYVKAIEQAKTFDLQKVLPILAKTKFDGASGSFEFNEIGDAVRVPHLKQVREGKLEVYSE